MEPYRFWHKKGECRECEQILWEVWTLHEGGLLKREQPCWCDKPSPRYRRKNEDKKVLVFQGDQRRMLVMKLDNAYRNVKGVALCALDGCDYQVAIPAERARDDEGLQFVMEVMAGHICTGKYVENPDPRSLFTFKSVKVDLDGPGHEGGGGGE